VVTSLSAPLNLSVASMGQHNENVIQADNAASFLKQYKSGGQISAPNSFRFASESPPKEFVSIDCHLMSVEMQCAFVVNSMTTKAHPVLFTTESDILLKY
jgi:hypothetical protein